MRFTRKSLCLLLAALLCLCAMPALAATLKLPADLTEIEAETFMGDTSLERVALPKTLTTIGEKAFANSTVNQIYLPASITYIADNAFDGCGEIAMTAADGSYGYNWAVEHGYIQLESSPAEDFATLALGSGVGVWYLGNDKNVVIPARINGQPVIEILAEAFPACVETVVIPNTVKVINWHAFYICDETSQLRSVTIPNSVELIDDGAFTFCHQLESISIPDSVTTIGAGAFSFCSSLKDIRLPSKLTAIHDSTFSYCTSLTEIDIPDSVKTLGANAFTGCEKLTEIKLPVGIPEIGAETFHSCTALTEIVIPEGVTSIGEDAFMYCENLTSVTLPSTLTTIGNYAFDVCTSLKEIAIPASVTSIGSMAFDRVHDDFSIRGDEGTYAETYAKEHYHTFLSNQIFEANSLKYHIDDGKLTVLGFAKVINLPNILEHLVIPETVNDMPVVAISELAFMNFTTKAMTIPPTVTSIKASAVARCDTIYGAAGSYAEEYANYQRIKFVAL